MFRFRSGFISRQTGDKKKKPETEMGEIPENRKNGRNRIWKVEKYRFPMWFMKVGPCCFWFRASSSDSMSGVDLGVNLGVDRDITNKQT